MMLRSIFLAGWGRGKATNSRKVYMRKILVVAVAVALFTAAFAGVAMAKTFVCKTIPCEGTNHADQIGERSGSVKDIIRAKGGDDTVNATRAGNDADDVLGQKGDDRINVEDGDFRDNANCGDGDDIAIVDFEETSSGSVNIDGVSGCEEIRTHLQASDAELTSMSEEEILAKSTPVPAEAVEAAEAKGRITH
jgi:hypothetical protein